jgi:DNA-binding cell septation regulator SpoVG
MDIRVISFSFPAPNKPRSVLATARVEITCDPVHKITLDDLRVLRNGQSEVWLGMPSLKNAHGAYFPIVEFSPRLKRDIEDAVLEAFEKWSPGQQSAETLPASGGATR